MALTSKKVLSESELLKKIARLEKENKRLKKQINPFVDDQDKVTVPPAFKTIFDQAKNTVAAFFKNVSDRKRVG